jgi:adenosine kinase
MSARILVTGSIAYDHIMTFPGTFRDHIVPEKMHVIHLSFLLKTLHKRFGGCAANIAYTLSLLGERPILAGAVGQDYDLYRDYLTKLNIDTEEILACDDLSTPQFFGITDLEDNQIGGFYVGAMARSSSISIHAIHERKPLNLAIVSANDPQAMARYVEELRSCSIPYIYDPSQQTKDLSPTDLTTGVRHAAVLVGNDYEISLFCRRAKLTIPGILASVEALVITKGAQGSTLMTKTATDTIPAYTSTRCVDPTGAGDAYRAGLLKGAACGLDWLACCRIATISASFAIEQPGTQEHSIEQEEFHQRFQNLFACRCPITFTECTTSRN